MDEEMNFEFICRICLQQEDQMKSIFDMDAVREVKLSDKIEKCSTLKISNESLLPEQICSKCIDDLEIAFRFRMNCENSNAILRTYLEVYMDQNIPESQVGDDNNIQEENFDGSGDDNFSIDTMKRELQEPELDMQEGITTEEIIEEEYQIEYLDDINDAGKNLIMVRTSINEKTNDEKAVVVHNKPVRQISKSLEPRKRSSSKKALAEICNICGNTYRSKSILAVHMQRHNGQKPFACELCDTKFVTRSGVSRHMRTHTGEKPYQCKICLQKFSDYSTRNRHERTHTGERPYICPTCGQTFTYNHVLTTHMLVHTGEKNFQCEICLKRFAKSYHLTQHKNVHLRAEGKPYRKYIRPKRIEGEVVKGGTIMINPKDPQMPMATFFTGTDCEVDMIQEISNDHQETETEFVGIVMS